MLLQTLIFAVGLGVLYLGAEWLVRGAASLALKYGIRRLVVGITVVALGTSMPEFVVNLFAVLVDDHGMALGNVVGSNICNIALILGASALVLPLVVKKGTLRKEYPIMMGVMVLFYLVSLDGQISQLDGLLLVLGLIAFLVYLVVDTKKNIEQVSIDELPEVERRDVTSSTSRKVVLLLSGMLFLAGGARLMVLAATNMANAMGIDHVIIGLTVVAIGTSLPELAASLVSALKKDPDMSIGNVLGSNLFNVLFVIGLVSMIQPLSVETEALQIHFPIMLAFGVLFLPIAWTSYKITRLEGGFLLTAFAGYIVYLVIPYV